MNKAMPSPICFTYMLCRTYTYVLYITDKDRFLGFLNWTYFVSYVEEIANHLLGVNGFVFRHTNTMEIMVHWDILLAYYQKSLFE